MGFIKKYKEWYSENLMPQSEEEKKAYKKKWYLENRERLRLLWRKYDAKRKEQKREYDKRKHREEKELILAHYGRACAWWGNSS